MQFFKIEAKLAKAFKSEDKEYRSEFTSEVRLKTEPFYLKNDRKLFVFVSNVKNDRMVIGAIFERAFDTSAVVDSFIKYIEVDCIVVRISEITINEFENLVRSADEYFYIEADAEIMEMFGLHELAWFRRGRGTSYVEYLLKETPAKQTLACKAKSLLCGDTLAMEISRIYEGAAISVKSGNPVHYLIQTDDVQISNEIIKILLSALYANKRIENQRYCSVSFHSEDNAPGRNYESLYKASSGGAVIVSYAQEESEESDMARTGSDVIIGLCNLFRKHRNDVLSVICLPRSCEKIKRVFMENLGSITLIELREEAVFADKARDYLRRLARRNGIASDKQLYSRLKNSVQGYLGAELNKIFDEWFARRLKEVVYPQYAAMEAANKSALVKKTRGNGIVMLDEMIGLSEAKTVIKQALDYYKAQKLFHDRGIQSERPSMNMVFTGNPGTAKTTVARLFAQIMKENGLLSVGDLHELGRADLVARYVGWTAPQVKNWFRAAKGSVLFIDEAYSLVEDRDGLYGDEAINTIVQEMENQREDIVVIFAGYPEKMEQFLQKNPGLRSRIAFHIPFSDYCPSELWQITELMAGKMQFRLDAAVQDKLSGVFKRAVCCEDFGNGRYVRNLLEKAQMRQASRLVAMDIDQVTDEIIKTLIDDDFEELALTHELRKVWKIGFGA